MSAVYERSQLKEFLYLDATERLFSVVTELSAARTLERVMDIIRHSVCDLTGSDGATFVLRENNSCYYAEEAAISPLWKGKRFPIDVCISGWVMMNKKPAVIEDIYKDARIPIDAYRKTFVKSLLMVPIRSSDPIGAIGSYWKDRHHPTAGEIMILQVLADTAAISMDNIGYQNVIEAKTVQLENAIDGTFLAFAKLLEHKDPYTAGHQRRVAWLSKMIAAEIGMSDESCVNIFRAGAVHDVGKIGIPSELLSKPSRLTELEFSLIKTHSEEGYMMVKDIPLLGSIADIILQHHERINGSGYPYGLSKESLLPESRIIAVADVFESMISDRPYRPARSWDTAIEELRQNSGILYDEDVVDAALSLILKPGFTFDD